MQLDQIVLFHRYWRFEIMPRYFPAGMNTPKTNNSQANEAIRITRKEYLRISNKLLKRRALRAKIRENSDRFYVEVDKEKFVQDDLKHFVRQMKSLSIDFSLERRSTSIKYFQYCW